MDWNEAGDRGSALFWNKCWRGDRWSNQDTHFRSKQNPGWDKLANADVGWAIPCTMLGQLFGNICAEGEHCGLDLASLFLQTPYNSEPAYDCEHSQQNQTLNQVWGWLCLKFGAVCDQSCFTQSGSSSAKGLKQPCFRSCSRKNLEQVFSLTLLCVCLSVSKALLCLLVTKKWWIAEVPIWC